MLNEYKEISKKDLDEAYSKAWSIENMEAHGAENGNVKYIGSTTMQHAPNIVIDYYMDNMNNYWYGKRAIVNGELVSMEQYIFGKEEIKDRRYNRYRQQYRARTPVGREPGAV